MDFALVLVINRQYDTCSRDLSVSADNAYFTACDRLKLRYLQELQERDPETLHEGVVVRTTTAGLAVSLPKLGIFGFVPRPRFAPSAFRRNRREDARETAEFRCGDPVLLRLSMIDPVRNSAEFTLARKS